MEEAWIDRLPQDLLQRVIPLETPRDACRAAAVSQAFRAVADSDVVWGKFQPDDSSLQLADGELFPPPRSKKERFLRLSAGLLLLPDRRRVHTYLLHRSLLVFKTAAISFDSLLCCGAGHVAR